jgi:hypothetical protein
MIGPRPSKTSITVPPTNQSPNPDFWPCTSWHDLYRRSPHTKKGLGGPRLLTSDGVKAYWSRTSSQSDFYVIPQTLFQRVHHRRPPTNHRQHPAYLDLYCAQPDQRATPTEQTPTAAQHSTNPFASYHNDTITILNRTGLTRAIRTTTMAPPERNSSPEPEIKKVGALPALDGVESLTLR